MLFSIHRAPYIIYTGSNTTNPGFLFQIFLLTDTILHHTQKVSNYSNTN